EMEGYLGDEGINPITAELFFKGEAAPDGDKVAQGRKRVGEELEYFSRELRGKFLAGDAPTAADFVLYPYLGYCARISFRKPETKLEALLPPSLADYKKRIEALPYFDKTFPPHWR
ncbi:MAG: glutathione S-transferase family protein, partial [Usitatibacter sp.]